MVGMGWVTRRLKWAAAGSQSRLGSFIWGPGVLGSAATAVPVYIMGWNLPTWILANPWLANLATTALGGIIAIVAAILVRFVYAMFHFPPEHGTLRERFGPRFWPAVILISTISPLYLGIICIVWILINNGVVGHCIKQAPNQDGSEQTKLINAIAQLTYFQEALDHFDRAADSYDKAVSSVLEDAKANQAMRDLRGPDVSARISEPVKRLVKADFGIDLDLTKHPNFDKNQAIPAPNESGISDEMWKIEYRRFFDTYQTSKPIIAEFRSKYAQKISDAKAIISRDVTYNERKSDVIRR